MKRYAIPLIVFSVMMIFGCSKSDESGEKEVTIAKKYAKYRVSVYKEKELKTWAATLAKAEDVSLLAEESITDSKGRKTDISKVKLADDTVAYVETRHLADTPIVFTEDVKAFVRPTSGSTIYTTIPKGELGFIIQEKGLWVQVYVGKVNAGKSNEKNVTQQWIEGGYSKDSQLVLTAKEYSSAIDNLAGKEADKVAHAKETLEDISNGSTLFAALAKEKLNEISGVSNGMNTEEPDSEDNTDIENFDEE